MHTQSLNTLLAHALYLVLLSLTSAPRARGPLVPIPPLPFGGIGKGAEVVCYFTPPLAHFLWFAWLFLLLFFIICFCLNILR